MRILAVVVVLGLAGSFAEVARADDAQRAKELFEEGTRYFDLGQFDKAIDAWQAGYRQKADSRFLYNIAQAYRLAGDTNKAIFFYKGYLRNSPKASNRPEVELKIQTLQKQAAEESVKLGPRPPVPAPGPEPAPEPGRPGPSPPPVAAAPPSPAPPQAGAPAAAAPAPRPPSATSSGAPAGTSTTVAAGEPPPVVSTSAPELGPIETLRPIDVALAIGVDGWASGVQGKADPSFALMLAGGYTFGQDPRAPVRFRLGVHFGYTFLKELNSRETFLSALLVPTIVVRASARLSFFGELGLGVVGVSGLKQTSVLLERQNMLKISGTQGLAEVRPALGLTLHLTPGLGLFASAAANYSPKKEHFYAAINRTELLLGAALRL